MCKFRSQFLVGVLTFAISVAFTAATIYSIQIPKVEVIETSISEPIYLRDNPGEIEIKYENSLEGIDESHAIFSVKNNSNESVYYFGDHQTNNQNSYIKQNGKITYLGMYEGVTISEQELKPKESTWFWMPAPQNEKPFEAEFGLKLGEKRKEQTILVEVPKQFKR